MTQATDNTAHATFLALSDSLAEEAKGDRQAFNRLYRMHAPRLYRYFWFHIRLRLDTQDRVSETFLEALHTLGSYSAQRGPFIGWLFGIAKRVLARYAEERARPGCSIDTVAEQAADLELVDLEIDLWRAVGELPGIQRDVIALKFGAGLTHREVAAITGLREGHVGVVLYRTLQKLRTQLAGEESSDEQ